VNPLGLSVATAIVILELVARGQRENAGAVKRGLRASDRAVGISVSLLYLTDRETAPYGGLYVGEKGLRHGITRPVLGVHPRYCTTIIT
jgi:hypothetical protein